MREVTFCERSTITEAWAVVLGAPVPVVSEEPAAIVLAAKRTLRELEPEPALVVAEIPRSGPVAPFWSQQWSWDGGRLRARVGHRYLSVHRLADEDHRYETYERSLAPALGPWLHACSRAYDDALVMPAFEEVSYGYINTFQFPSAGFDLSRFFHLTLGVELGSLDGLDGLDVKFQYRIRGQPKVQVVIQLSTRQEAGAGDSLMVQLKTTATNAVSGGFWRDHHRIEQEILDTKSVAKHAFFEFATEETHQEMGAQYGNPA